MWLLALGSFYTDRLVKLRQDAPLGSDLAVFATNSTNFNSSIPFLNQTISWNPLIEGWDGFALLVDDVERFAGTALNFSLETLNPSLPHFFRLAVGGICFLAVVILIMRLIVHVQWCGRRFHYGCYSVAQQDVGGPTCRTFLKRLLFFYTIFLAYHYNIGFLDF